MDAASSKPTQKSLSLAEGPKTQEVTQSTKSSSSWTQSLISAVVKTVASSNASETSKSLPPDKVNTKHLVHVDVHSLISLILLVNIINYSFFPTDF